jgi:hypothetical protein
MADNLSVKLETCHRYVRVWQDSLHPYFFHELLHNFNSVIDSTVITFWSRLLSVSLSGNAYITGSSDMVGRFLLIDVHI